MITVQDLTIVDGVDRPILNGVSLRVSGAERVAIVGESGSGKTTLALALLGAIRPGLRVSRGRILVAGHDVLTLPGRALRALRGRVICYLPQDPASALTPTMRVRDQILELAEDRTWQTVARQLIEVGLPAGKDFLRRYPHQLSGGQQQRLALARFTAADPRILVLDEPTTGLDGPAQNLVLNQIDALARRRSLTLIFITHDLTAAARIADRLLVLRAGTVEEEGRLPAVMDDPKAEYTRELIRAVPKVTEAERLQIPDRPPGDPVLDVRDLRAGHGRGLRRQTVTAGVSFTVGRGECVALLGLSGSGKTTIARCVVGLHRPDSGTVLLHGRPLPSRIQDRTVDQRRKIQLVPQHSAGSLNPRRTVGASIAHPLRVLRGLRREQVAAETARLLSLVELPPDIAARYPDELSGGQRQRVTIARALAAEPDVLICDEMTSSLDVRVQAAVLDLVTGLRRRLGLAVLLITHDLGVLARTADRVLVLHDGRVCEHGPVRKVLRDPQHEWTSYLVAAASVRSFG